jgi:hypothetical protein
VIVGTTARVVAGPSSACVVVALAGCSELSTSAVPDRQPVHNATSGKTIPATAHRTTPTTSPTATTELTFAAIDGTYVAGTADGGFLYIRYDGACRFSGPDSVACPTCTTATAPLAHVDFSLNALHPTGDGTYSATGAITAESDPAWAAELGAGPVGAGPVGSSVSLTVSPRGALALSFLPSNDVLTRSCELTGPVASFSSDGVGRQRGTVE